MPIPNVSTLYKRIASGSEGGNEFARYIKLLLNADCAGRRQQLIAESDASGDFRKLDAFIPAKKPDTGIETGFQFKFYPSRLTSKQKIEIRDGMIAALNANKGMREYVVVTPEDWHKETQTWFAELQDEFEKYITIRYDWGSIGFHFKLTHWGHTKIQELVLKHDHLGTHYYPELFPVGVGKFKLAHTIIDCDNSLWFPYDDAPYNYYQVGATNKKRLTTDPVFDFSFTNSSPEIFLLRKIEIHIENVTTQLKGIGVPHLLRSIGTIEHELSFKEPIEVINLSDPMVFESNKAMRFKLQLKNFTKECPGNCVSLKFWFHFNDYSIPTDSFYLSF